MSATSTPENFPPITGGLTDALSHTQIYYDYFTPKDIRAVKPTYLNEGNLALKGLVHDLDFNPMTGIYTAKAALGNVAAHDNVREVAGVKDHYGFRPPETFAHDFAMIFSKYYPRVDKAEGSHMFDRRRDDATIRMFDEGEMISHAIQLRLTLITSTLARAIVHGLHPTDEQIRGGLSTGFFVPSIPLKSRTKSEYNSGE